MSHPRGWCQRRLNKPRVLYLDACYEKVPMAIRIRDVAILIGGRVMPRSKRQFCACRCR